MVPLHRAIPAPRVWPKAHWLLIIALMATACRDSDVTPDVDQIVERVVEARSGNTSAHHVAELATEMQWDPDPGLDILDAMTMTLESWTVGQNMRVEVQGNRLFMGNSVTVSDGVTGRTLMQDASQAFEAPMPAFDDTEVLISPDQGSMMPHLWVPHWLQRADVELAGVEGVAGREAYRLEARSKAEGGDADDAEPVSGTVWVDREYFYPLKLDVPTSSTHVRFIVREIEFDVPIPPERFELDLPADDALTKRTNSDDASTTTAEEAAAKAGFSLLSVDPAKSDYQLERTTVRETPGADDGTRVVIMQTYRGAAGLASVQQMLAASYASDYIASMSSLGDSRTVQVGGREATLVTTDNRASTLIWQSGETLLTVSSRLSDEALIALAESFR